jgi:hypothetical protein
VIHGEDPDGFFARLVTGDESWFHYCPPEKLPNSDNFCIDQEVTRKMAVLPLFSM